MQTVTQTTDSDQTLKDARASVRLDNRLRSVLRGLAGQYGSSMPVCVVRDTENPEPQLAGESWHYETKGGRRIYHPSAYAKCGWSNMCYCASTRRIEVDADWLAERHRLLTTVILTTQIDLDTIGPRGEDDRLSIIDPRAIYRDVDRNAAMITQRPGRYGVAWWLDSTVVQVAVKDSTTGLRHHLTVPPRFARPLEAGETEADRIRSAIAWTFDLDGKDYSPAIEA